MSNKAIIQASDCGCGVDLTDAEKPVIQHCAMHAAVDELVGVVKSIPTEKDSVLDISINNVLAKINRPKPPKGGGVIKIAAQGIEASSEEK